MTSTKRPKKLPNAYVRGKTLSLGVTLGEKMYSTIRDMAIARDSSISAVIRDLLFSALKNHRGQ